MNLRLFSKVLSYFLKNALFFLLVFFISRLVFLISYGNDAVLLDEQQGILNAFVIGARFDISAICYGFLPLVLGLLISLFIPQQKDQGFKKIFSNITKYYLLVVLVVYVTLIIIDYFFYQFFQSHINLLFFGIFNDDTTAVLTSVWTDYPLFIIALIYVAAIVSWLLWNSITAKQFKNSNKTYNKILSVVALLFFPLFFVGMRGSVGTFTLRREHTNVSKNEFVNSLCYNALYSLKFANSERKDNQIIPDIEKELEAGGYTSVLDVQQKYKSYTDASFDEHLMLKTAYNEFLEKNPPNVVFLQMESMSNHYFELNSPEFNLLGELTEQLPDLYYFKNGLSSYNGTIQSLEDFLIGTPKTIISQSVYFDTPFSSSIALPFKHNGYATYFLTGASISWRNIDNMIKQQGFDFIEGKNFIQEKFPNAEEFAWGVHDGYLFDYIKEKLKENTKPKFIFGLTISNHTPFEVPKYFNKQPIKMPKLLENQIRVSQEIAYDNFYSHQYAASELGRLIKEIKNSPLGENTIIVASGDHNIRQVFEYPATEGFLKRSVPILMYIPEKYKPTFFDDQVIAGHKDIFPTIFNLALSNTSYSYTGDNLFADIKYRFAINEYNFIADNKGVVTIENNKPYYYTWKSKEKRTLEVNKTTAPHAAFLLEVMNSYTTMKTINIYEQIVKAEKE